MHITDTPLKEVFKALTGKDFEAQLTQVIENLEPGKSRVFKLSEIEDRPVMYAMVFNFGNGEYGIGFVKDYDRETGEVRASHFYSPEELAKVLGEPGLEVNYISDPERWNTFGPLTIQQTKNLLFAVIDLNYATELKRGAVGRIWGDDSAPRRKYRLH